MATTTTTGAIPETEVGPRVRGLASVFATGNSITLTVMRVGLAIVFLPHGLQKVFGVMGGQGFSATMAMFTQQMGIPPLFAFLAIMTEFLGPIALLLGFFTRLAALAITLEMIVAVMMVHAPNGFFMNWAGNQAGEGFEYHILAMTLAVALVLSGGGRCSLDRMMAASFRRK
jgi:putative oxidoreductase